MNIEPGPEMAITHKKKMNSPKSGMNKKKDASWCFPDCTMHHKHNGDMVQCHICQTWAHYQCINEEKSDIIGIWCCNNSRKLPDRVNLLCTHMNQLRRDMATLINYARAFQRYPAGGNEVSHSDTTPDCYDINDNTNGYISPTISLRDDQLQPTEEDNSKRSSVNVDANQNEGTPEKSCTLNVTHTCTPDNSDNNTVSTMLSTVTPEMNNALDTTHSPDNNDKNIVSTSRSCAVISEKSSVLDITHAPDNSNRRTVSLRRQINFVDDSQFCMFSNKTSCIKSSQDVVETVNTLQRNTSGVEPDNNSDSKPDNNDDSKSDNNDDSKRRSNKYVPMHIHDIYMGHVPPTFTEDAVHSYLRDIDIKHIIRVSKLLTHEKYAEFRVIIGDEDIKDTLYGTRKIYRDVVIMTFKEFRQNTNTHHRYCNRQSHDINNTGRTEKSENSRKDRFIEVENSHKKSYRSLGKKPVTYYSRTRYIKRSQLHDRTDLRHKVYKDHPQNRSSVDIQCTQNQQLSTNMKPSGSVAKHDSRSHFKFTQSQPHQPSERTAPSNEPVQNQQPDGSFISATLKKIQPAQRSFSDAVLAQSKQSQEPIPNGTLEGSQPVQTSLLSMTSTQSQPSQGPLINAISQGGQPLQRSLPSTEFTHSQQPKQFPQSTAYLQSQQPHCPFPEMLHLCNQHRPQGQQLQGPLLDAVFPLSEQYQRRFPNVMLGDNYSVQGFLSDATLEQSQQLQKILPDTTCVGSHPAQGLPLAQRSQPQEMLTSDILPLTQQAWGPLSAVAYKDTQPLQGCVYPPTPLTQGTVPCTAS